MKNPLPRSRAMRLALPLLAAALAAACTSNPAPSAPGSSGAPQEPSGARPPAGSSSARAADLPVMDVPDLETRALLLLLVDRQVYEPLAVEQALKGGPELREELAAALGRIPDPQGRPILEGLLADEAPGVRRAAAFALGELEDARAVPALLRVVADPDRETGTLAVEALGKLGAPVIEVAERLVPLTDAERWARLLPYLFRFKEEARIPLAESGLAMPDRELHARAAFALAREPLPDAAPHLRTLLADPDPQVRAWAARGLAEVGAAEDLARLEPLLDAAETGPVAQALRTAPLLIQGKKAPAPDSWRARLAALASDPRPGVRVAALEAAGSWPLDGGPGAADSPLARALVERAERSQGGTGRERGVALVALAAARHPRAAELALAAAKSTDPDVRARAAEAAVKLVAAGSATAGDLAARLAADPSPEVRGAALDAWLAADEKGGPEIARAALRDRDEGVRATALAWLEAHPTVPLEALGPALDLSLADDSVETPLSAVKALTARAEGQPLERGAIVALLEKVAADRRWVLRREAAASLVKLGRPAPPLGMAAEERPVDAYREIVQRTSRPRRVELQTAKGTIGLRLDCPQAPLTCINFLQLAGQGFFDGIGFHRVVPDFVIQGGDPRGDGYGGPPYTIRDEINRLRYGRGVLGMALAGPDTGGSQFFITLSPQPHLDGGYTVFGEVTSGQEVLDQIQADDKIVKVVEVP